MTVVLKWPNRGRLIAATLPIFWVAACTAQAPPTTPPKTGDSAPAAKPGVTVASPATPVAPPAPAAASPAVKTAASPAPAASPATKAAASPVAAAKAAPRVEPRGKMTYGMHISLSPVWLDPQEAGGTLSDYTLLIAVHDALVRTLPGQPYAPALAESYEVANDYKSATFKLRPGIKFHNGDPVTPEDVKFTYEKFRGPNASIFKEKTEAVEVVDSRTVRMRFKEPFVDFMVLFGGFNSPIGWIVPAKYYQEVGPDGFKQKPIGAGPYKFVRQVVGQEVELEANSDYWRKTPSVKTLVFKGIPELTTRVAALQTGEIDFAGGLLPLQREQIESNPQLKLAPILTTNYWLEFPGMEKPDNPFRDKRVRQAISLGLDRKAIVDFHTGGLGENPGNWVTRNWMAGAVDLPPPEFDRAKAQQLLAEAGHPNGLDGFALTGFPPNNALAEHLQAQLREFGVRTNLNLMERAAYATKIGQGPGAFPDGLLNTAFSVDTAAGAIRQGATCKGSGSRTCIPEIEDRYQQYEKSVDLRERERLIAEIQRYMADNYIFVPILRNVFVNAQGPRAVNPVPEIWGAMANWLYLGPYEDVQMKD